MLDKTTSSLDQENLHEVFFTLMKIQRNNKKHIFFSQISNKMCLFLMFYFFPMEDSSESF